MRIKRIGHTLAELLVPIFIYALFCIENGYVISKIIGVYVENLILKGIMVTVSNIAFGCILLLIYRYLFRMKIKEYFVFSVFDVKKIFCIFLFVQGYTILISRFLYELRIEELPYILGRSSTLYSWQEVFCVAVSAIFSAPFMEEIIFRLGMFGFARSRAGKLYGLFLSSILFAFAHNGGRARSLYLVIDAIVLAILLWKTRNILYPMLLHLSSNLWLTILGIADRLISRRYGKIEGVLAWTERNLLVTHDILLYISIVGLVIGMVLYYHIYHRKRDKKENEVFKKEREAIDE